jgi:hypothetical protein
VLSETCDAHWRKVLGDQSYRFRARWSAMLRNLDGKRNAARSACPYRKSKPQVLMVQPTKDGPRFDAPRALNDPSNRRILT